MALRLKAMGQKKYSHGFKLTLHPGTLELPLMWKKPQRIFVNSMSDLFHHEVPLNYIQRVFDTMTRAYWHQFQVLTKRSGRLLALTDKIDWPANVWMGVSVESERYKARIDHLRKTGAAVKFLSLEPLLGSLGRLDLTDIDWVIVGGESGPGARPMRPEWSMKCASNASAPEYPSSLSSGVEFRKSVPAVSSMVERTMKCRSHR